MDTAFAWIQQIADWCGMWVPRWLLLDVTEQAVKVIRGGARIVVCKPGKVHWYWPLCTRCFVHPVARQTINLKSQTITLKCGKTIVVGGLVVIEVSDIRELLCNTFSPDEAIKDISLSAVHDVCCQLNWDEIMAAQRDGNLDKQLKQEARRELDKYGVRVKKMTLTDLAPCRVLKVVQATTVD